MKYKNLTLSITLSIIALISFSALSHGDKHIVKGEFNNLDTAAGKVVVAFHQALRSGDKATARNMLADDVLIFEGGGVERSADQYANHHMLSDMKFLAAVSSTSLEHQVKVMGDTAVSMSRSKTQGTYKGKERNFEGMETMVLEKQGGAWKIVHIHWSN